MSAPKPYIAMVGDVIAACKLKDTGVSAAVVTCAMSELSRAKGKHSDMHMVSDVGGPDDNHLKKDYAERPSHSMFDSPDDAITAVTAALNTDAGVAALGELLHQEGHVELWSRTGAAALSCMTDRQFSAPTVTRTSSPIDHVVVVMSNFAIEATVVNDKKTTKTLAIKAPKKPATITLRCLAITSAYPVAPGTTRANTMAGNPDDDAFVMKKPTVQAAKFFKKRDTALVNW